MLFSGRYIEFYWISNQYKAAAPESVIKNKDLEIGGPSNNFANLGFPSSAFCFALKFLVNVILF